MKVYTLEKVRVRQFPRGWGFVQGVKFLPILLGSPLSAYINAGDSPKGGFFLSLACLLVGGTCLFAMRCFKQAESVSRGYSFASSRMDLCKTDTNFTFEGGGAGGHGGGGGGPTEGGPLVIPNDPHFNIENMMRRRPSESLASNGHNNLSRKDSHSLVLAQQPSFFASSSSNNNNNDEVLENSAGTAY